MRWQRLCDFGILSHWNNILANYRHHSEEGLPEGEAIHLMFEEHLAHADCNQFLGGPVLIFNPGKCNLFVHFHQTPKKDMIDAHLERGVESNGCCQLLLRFGQGCGSWGSYDCSSLAK